MHQVMQATKNASDRAKRPDAVAGTVIVVILVILNHRGAAPAAVLSTLPAAVLSTLPAAVGPPALSLAIIVGGAMVPAMSGFGGLGRQRRACETNEKYGESGKCYFPDIHKDPPFPGLIFVLPRSWPSHAERFLTGPFICGSDFYARLDGSVHSAFSKASL
jgi:hypothetical protein